MNKREIANKILKALSEQNVPVPSVLNKTLGQAFFWGNTSEGSIFWNTIYRFNRSATIEKYLNCLKIDPLFIDLTLIL